MSAETDLGRVIEMIIGEINGIKRRLNTDTAQDAVTQALIVKDGVTAPSTTSGLAKIYVDSGTGDLMVRFGDGTTKTIVTDT